MKAAVVKTNHARRRIYLFILVAVGALTLCAIYFYWRYTKISFADLPPIIKYVDNGDPIYNSYRVDPYIRLAQRLQSMGRTAACEKLLYFTRDGHVKWDHEQQIEILCRMLFKKRQGSDFRESYHGVPRWIGGTSYADWPLVPIEIIDGVPFVITSDFGAYYGPLDNYLYYCMANCDWSDYKFTPKTEQQKKDALVKLVASPKWKTPLTQEERDWFASQIR